VSCAFGVGGLARSVTGWVSGWWTRHLEFVAGRCRPNTLRAVVFDLKAFFLVVAQPASGIVVANSAMGSDQMSR
jgi:hypothetical protein